MIKLVTRIEVTDDEELVLQLIGDLPSSLDGYESGKYHQEPPMVQQFLQENGFAWSPRYVPVFVYREGDNADEAGAAIKAYGIPFLLRNETVVPDLEIVCCNDIQNAVLNHRPVSDFTDLRSLSPDDKIRALVAARDKATRYAEARMYRPLRLSDVDRAL